MNVLTPPVLAAAFLLVAIPASIWAAMTDLRQMKIPNKATALLLVGFIAISVWAIQAGHWTIEDFAIRMLQGLVVLLVGFFANMIGGMGAGDAKFFAATAPFISLADSALAVIILTSTMLVAFTGHRIARATVGPRMAPDWTSWSTGRRFPMGVAFGLALVIYLAIVATR